MFRGGVSSWRQTRSLFAAERLNGSGTPKSRQIFFARNLAISVLAKTKEAELPGHPYRLALGAKLLAAMMDQC